MIQGVREIFEMIEQGKMVARGGGSGQAVNGGGGGDGGSGRDTTTTGKIVLIGKGMAGLPFEESLNAALCG